MKYEAKRISGNSYTIVMVPVSAADKELLAQNSDDKAIIAHYHEAVKTILGPEIRLASLTANDDFPYSATAEMLSESGSV